MTKLQLINELRKLIDIALDRDCPGSAIKLIEAIGAVRAIHVYDKAQADTDP